MIYIIIVNWNGWKDTIECLESIFANTHINYKVVVCDNCSTDYSVNHIVAWAEGRLDAYVLESNPLRKLTWPPTTKPILYCLYEDNAITPLKLADSNAELIIIKINSNLGFSGGNNVGIKYALLDNQCSFLWLLNNDTVVAKDSLSCLVNHGHVICKSNVGIIGSKILYYHKPNIIQSVAGIYNKWLSIGGHLGDSQVDSGQYDVPVNSVRIDYVVGASMFVRREFIETVGLMSEDFFLYYEEIDWYIRGTKLGWLLDYCYESIIYHKEGASIGTNKVLKRRSKISDYYCLKNRLVISSKYFPKYFYFVYIGLVLTLLKSLIRLDLDRASMIGKILLGAR